MLVSAILRHVFLEIIFTSVDEKLFLVLEYRVSIYKDVDNPPPLYMKKHDFQRENVENVKPISYANKVLGAQRFSLMINFTIRVLLRTLGRAGGCCGEKMYLGGAAHWTEHRRYCWALSEISGDW